MNSLLKDFLEREGYAVTGMQSAVGALNWLRSQTRIDFPQLVLSDVFMGECSGLDLTRLLAREFPQVPVVLFSVVREMEKAALSSGAIRFLPKPFPLTRLAAVVAEEIKGV